MTRHSAAATLGAWALAWLVVSWLLAATHYGSRDPDSQLYAAISARLVREPLPHWIAPQWWGLWNTSGPYAEHPVGMFVVPAVLGRAGYPSLQAAYAITALYQAAAFALVTLIAASVVPRRHAVALGWILQLLPIAFVFRVRANQEYAVLVALLFAIYATERARHQPAWILGMIAGFGALLLVKGVFAVMVPIACALWLIARASSTDLLRQHWPAWLALAAMPAVGAVAAWGYEAAYVHVTGQSFLTLYQSRQLPESALAGGSLLLRTGYTATWYFTRLLWYAFPWSVVAMAATASALRRGWWRSWPITDDTPAPRQGAVFAMMAGVVLTAAFSLAHRKADRYIFPVYFLIGACGAGVALARYSAPGGLIDRLDRPWVPALFFVLLVMLTLISSGKLPQFTFWRT